MTPIRWAMGVAIAVLVAACGAAGTSGGDGSAGRERPVVVATTSILGDLVSNVVGDQADVEVLMSSEVDPHAYEPSARQIATLREAVLVVANGLGLAPALEDPLEGARREGVPVLAVAEEVDPIPFGEHAGDHGHDEGEGSDEAHAEEQGDEGRQADEAREEGDEHGSLDPHVWMDPLRMARAVGLVAHALEDASPGLAPEELRASAQSYAAEIEKLHDEVVEVLGPVSAERRILVTNHDSLGYFAARYGFEVLGTLIPGGSTLAEPSAGALSDLAEAIREAGVPAVFAEATHPRRLADALASQHDLDVEIVSLYTGALGPAGSGAETYLGLIRTDAELIAEALTRGSP